MPSYLHPGVYLEEIASGSRPIEGVATSVTAFVGFTYRGEVGVPKLIGKFDDYVNEFGPIVEDDPMGLAVRAFYLNGGGSAYVCRLAADIGTSDNETDIFGAGLYDISSHDRAPTTNPVLSIKASSPGKWGNNIRYKIEKNHRDSRLFTLLVGEYTDGEFKEQERFDNLSMNESSSDYAWSRIKEASKLIVVEDHAIDDTVNSYQEAKIVGAEIVLLDVKNYLKGNNPSIIFDISINGVFKKVDLTGVQAITTGNVISANLTLSATDVIEILKYAINKIFKPDTVSVSYANKQFSIETQSDNSSENEIILIDSPLLDALGLSSNNRAILTGEKLTLNSGKVPSPVQPGDKFDLILDQYETIEINFSSLNHVLDDGHDIANEIQRQVNDAFPDILSFSGFTCTFNNVSSTEAFFKLTSGGIDVLESEIKITSGTINDAATKLKLVGTPVPVKGRTIQQGIDVVVPIIMTGINSAGELLHNGKDSKPLAGDFTTFYNTTLRKFRDISILVVPCSSWDGDLGQANLSASLAHCEFMKNRVLILDPPEGKDLDNAVEVRSLGLPTSTYSVLYYPWLSMNNPLYHPDKNPLVSKTVNVAPSAIAAGMWAKIDGKRGVWKAPAGVKTQITGALGLEFTVEDLEQDQLNPLGINSIRKIPNFGSVFWGARTLATKADPEWRYVPVRRTAIFIEESIFNGIQWAVFEPNTHLLWSSLRANIGSFMNGLFRSGAFQGEKANDAYFVRCGLGDTMTQGDIDRGQVIVIVGFAPVKPAEFVIVRIQQKVGEV